MVASSHEHSEELCQRCGRCCHEKLSIDGVVVITDVPCQHYDEQSSSCRVYQRRHSEEVRCITVAGGIEAGAFPADCPYVQDLKGYKGAITIEEAVEKLGLSREELNDLAKTVEDGGKLKNRKYKT